MTRGLQNTRLLDNHLLDGPSSEIPIYYGDASDGALSISDDPNLLFANQANIETDTSGFTAITSTVSRSTAEYWQGSASLRVQVTSAGTARGVYSSVEIPLICATSYVFSFYIKGTGVMKVACRPYTSGTAGTLTYSLTTITPDSNWTRYEYSFSLTGSENGFKFYIVTNAATTADIYLDGLQVEVGSTASTWTDSSRSSPGGFITTELTSTADGELVVKQYSSITIGNGQVLTVSNRCAGLVLYVAGNVTISGALSMSTKGGVGYVYPFAAFEPGDFSIISFLRNLPSSRFPIVGGAGGAGGAGGGAATASTRYSGQAGTGGPGRIGMGGFGGGGGGGAPGGGNSWNVGTGKFDYETLTPLSSNAYNITVWGYDGGPSCGGAGGRRGSSSSGSAARGGQGGYGPGGGGGGGSWTSLTGYSGADGTNGEYPGGLIVLVVQGNIVINANGLIISDGGRGGAGGADCSSPSDATGGGGGGGGSGGGVILIFHKGTYTNNGSIRCSGGGGGASGLGDTYDGVAGTSGSAGTVEVNQL